MLLRLIFFLFGFGLMVIGFMYSILYLNLLDLGYSFLDYVKFISRSWVCWYAVFGLVIITLTIYVPRRERDDYL